MDMMTDGLGQGREGKVLRKEMNNDEGNGRTGLVFGSDYEGSSAHFVLIVDCQDS